MATRVTSLALSPLHGVHHVARVLDADVWESSGEGVQLVAEARGRIGYGPTRFELDVLSIEGDGAAPSLRFDFGEGFEDASAVVLQRSLQSQPCSAVIALRAPPLRLRVDPGSGRFLCSELRVTALDAGFAPAAAPRVAVILHLSRIERWPEMAQYLTSIAALERLFVALPQAGAESVEPSILAAYPRAVLRRLADDEAPIASSLQMLEIAVAQGAELVCVVHTRSAPHLQGTDAGRWDLTHKLLGSREIVADILQAFTADPALGMVGPAGHVVSVAGRDDCVAGLMFWARTAALRPLRRLGLADADLDASAVLGVSLADVSLAAASRAHGFALRETRMGPETQTALDLGTRAFVDEALQHAGARTSADRTRLTTLRPLTGLEALDASSGTWRATHNDPQFSVDGIAALAGRWVLVTARLLAAHSAQRPLLYFDVGSGWTEGHCIALSRPAAAGGLTETVVFVPDGTLRARFDPIAFPGRFALRDFAIAPLTALQAAARQRQATEDAFDDSYASWIEHYEVPRADYPRRAEAQAKWPRPPQFSLVVAAQRSPWTALERLVGSVVAQVYPYWELWIAAGDSPEDRKALTALCATDRRIRKLDTRGATSLAATVNATLAHAAGSHFTLLDPMDRLHPLALHFIAEVAIASPEVALVYTDEDRIGAEGERCDPTFKCEFNDELLLAQDMVSNLACYRTALLREMGGMREGFPGAERHDLVLRVVERAGGAKVERVPRVLCHTGAREVPPETADSARRAVADHLTRIGRNAGVWSAPGAPAGMNRVRFDVPSPAPTVTIVIPTRDRADLLRTSVDSVLSRTTYPSFSVVIVDNGSVEDATRDLLGQYAAKGVTVVRDPSPFNFSAINNRAVAALTSEFVCLMNSDIEILTPDWLEDMVGFAAGPGVGAVGARLWYPDGRLQHGGLILGIGGFAAYAHRLIERGQPGYACRAILHQGFSAVTAACLLVRKTIYDQVGGLDERLAVAFNDVDFCLRVREAGYRNVWTPYAEMIHHESATRGAEVSAEKSRRLQGEMDFMRERWGKQLFDDPAYSPNLTLDGEQFTLAWPPRVAGFQP